MSASNTPEEQPWLEMSMLAPEHDEEDDLADLSVITEHELAPVDADFIIDIMVDERDDLIAIADEVPDMTPLIQRGIVPSPVLFIKQNGSAFILHSTNGQVCQVRRPGSDSILTTVKPTHFLVMTKRGECEFPFLEHNQQTGDVLIEGPTGQRWCNINNLLNTHNYKE